MLEASGHAAAVRQRHAGWCLGLGAEAAPGLVGAGQVEWLARLELERDNLRAAMQWLLDTGDRDAATRLGWDVWVFLWIHGYHAEGRAWMERVLAEGEGFGAEARARALGIRAAMALGQGEIAVAQASAEESAALFRAAGDLRSAARDGLVLGLIASARGEVTQAGVWLEEAAGVFRAAGEAFWAALSVSALGMLPFREGDFDRAEALLAEGHRLSLEAGDRLSRYIALYNQARVAQSRGDLARAAALYRDVLLFSLEAGDRANIAYCLEGLAAVAVARGDARGAARLLGAAQGLFDLVGSRVYTYRPDTRLREETLAAARSQLDARAWGTAWEAGAAMSLDEAVALALASVDGHAGAAAGGGAKTLPAEVRLMTTYGLTRREVDVLALLVEHRSYREMADTLYISPRTVGTHITSIRAKLGATSPGDVHRIAAEMGLRGL
jgi:non-specific serine/threonine protein kinase